MSFISSCYRIAVASLFSKTRIRGEAHEHPRLRPDPRELCIQIFTPRLMLAVGFYQVDTGDLVVLSHIQFAGTEFIKDFCVYSLQFSLFRIYCSEFGFSVTLTS